MTKAGEKHYVQAQACARCGACTAVCPVYKATGGREQYSARGRQYLRTIGLETEAVLENRDIFFSCLLCGACKKVCSKGIDSPAQVRAARASQGLFPGGYKKHLVRGIGHIPQVLRQVHKLAEKLEEKLGTKIPQESGLRMRLAMLNSLPDHPAIPLSYARPKTSALKEIVFYPGCATNFIAPEVMEAHSHILFFWGYAPLVPQGLVCCGTASLSLGDFAGAESLAKKNIEALEATEGPILVSCASCYAKLKELPSLFTDAFSWYSRAQNIAERVVDLAQFLCDEQARKDLSPKGVEGTKKISVFYHDPCHGRNEHALGAAPRQLLLGHGGFELLELPEGPQCCGLGGLFHIEAPEISKRIRDDLAMKVFALHPEIITTSCSGCLMQWRATVAHFEKDIRVLHITEALNL